MPTDVDDIKQEIRTLLIEADSALSWIYHRSGRAIECAFGRDFKEEILDVSSRCRKMSERLAGDSKGGMRDSTIYRDSCR